MCVVKSLWACEVQCVSLSIRSLKCFQCQCLSEAAAVQMLRSEHTDGVYNVFGGPRGEGVNVELTEGILISRTPQTLLGLSVSLCPREPWTPGCGKAPLRTQKNLFFQSPVPKTSKTQIF